MIVDQNLPQKIETKLGGEYNIESVINDDGTQTLNITSAEKAFDRLQWKCDNLKTLYYEFGNYNGESLSAVLNGLDTRQVTNTAYMFYKNSKLTEVQLFDTSNVTDMSYMFYGTTLLGEIPLFDTSKVTTMKYMFAGSYDGSGQTPKVVPLLDTSNVTDMSYMFYRQSSLENVPMFNTSKVTNMSYMLSRCYYITELPNWDTSNVTDMSQMLISTLHLKTIPKWNMVNVGRTSRMFYGSKIVTFPDIDTPNLVDATGTFESCTELVTIERFNLIKVTSNSNILTGCRSLTNLTLLNVKRSIVIGSGTTWGHLLTIDSLINTIKELWDYSSSTSTYKLTMGSANLEKIANTYVKLITPTEEMIANDPNIESKMPCEVCESTDEGAMLLTDYATLKRWTIA